MPLAMAFVSKVENLLQNFPFSHYGFARIERPFSMDFYKSWIQSGHHGQMAYLKEHMQVKEQPQLLVQRAVGAIVVAKSYMPHPYSATEAPIKSRVALYAQGHDYHHHFKAELEQVADALRQEFPDEEFHSFTDSAPILERDLAYRAGVGWFGKNTCMIHPKHGSLFFIGQILTSLPFENQKTPVPDFCGTCDRCIQACPTQAIEAPRLLNARKCIAYWTIEAQQPPPLEMRDKFSDWLFGCDICQTVCPWNEKLYGKEIMQQKSQTGLPVIEDLRWLLTQSNKSLQKAFQHSPLSRARPRGLKRNALLMIGNFKLSELRKETESYAEDSYLNEIARWALNQLG